jgi:type II secretory pathway component PulJ
MTGRAACVSDAGRSDGFTLIEVVGAFFLMVIVLVLVSGIFVENGRQRIAATELMRERLSAAAGLDLLASDLEGAVFLRPAEGADPDLHPWRVLAQDRGELGATALRFVTQNAANGERAEHASGWIEVAWFLDEDAEGRKVLWRWQSPRPPDEPPRGFPGPDEPGSARVVVGVSRFGVRFLDYEGGWVDEWDSSYQPPEQGMPLAAEVNLELFRRPRRGEALADESEVPGPLHSRRVAIVMPPIDPVALVALSREGADALACFTINDCLDLGDNRWWQEETSADCGGDDALCDMLLSPSSHCFDDLAVSYPEVAGSAPAGCAS